MQFDNDEVTMTNEELNKFLLLGCECTFALGLRVAMDVLGQKLFDPEIMPIFIKKLQELAEGESTLIESDADQRMNFPGISGMTALSPFLRSIEKDVARQSLKSLGSLVEHFKKEKEDDSC